MRIRKSWLVVAVALGAVQLGGVGVPHLAAQQKGQIPAAPKAQPGTPPSFETMPLPVIAPGGTVHLTLEEAKARALGNNKLLELASMNVQAKEYATRAMQANYFPQIVGNAVYFHFDNPLGEVLTTRGFPRLGLPGKVIDANVVNQDASFATIMAVQPLTALLKVKQGVKAAKADEQIALAQLEGGKRAVAIGVEQLYWGILAAKKIQAGAQAGVEGAELLLKKVDTVEAKIALLEAKQGLQEASNQVASAEDELNFLLDLPACTKLVLAEPVLPVCPFGCPNDAIAAALALSPDVVEAQQTILKAQAGVAAAKVDYIPNVAVMGGYANQQAASYIQNNFNYVGVVASYTFFDAGKRKATVREYNTLLAMANLKLSQVQDEVRQKVLKAYREVEQQSGMLATAKEMAGLRTEAVKIAKTPTDLIHASKDLAEASVALVKTEMNYRVAQAKLLNLTGR